MWHGWADQHISPLFTMQYYEAMQNTMGTSTVDQFARLYLVPGVGHSAVAKATRISTSCRRSPTGSKKPRCRLP
ncbi:tannase/feruloyl esterase family alpha/beta hydrolase [Paraburkholderia sp. WSM4175]|uniref:tannase/feruloyl esterase family alpha/beta hydrolase n=1 Tax=Paraburkholderia sp. WSM4175 TaxID=2991072 RepID=UPI003D217DA9